MKKDQDYSRRKFLAGSALGAAGAMGAGAFLDPGAMAAQVAGVKRTDLLDLTIKEIKVYQTDLKGLRKLNTTETGEIISVVTNNGIEGNYSIGDRNRTVGWLNWAKATLLGKNVIDLLPTIASTSGLKSGPPRRSTRGGGGGGGGFGAQDGGPGTYTAFGGPAIQGSGLAPRGGGSWPNWYTAAADVVLWDILGKYVNRPIYQILNGGTKGKDKMLAYASSTHLPTIEEFVPDALAAQKAGYKSYKIHPGPGQHKSGPLIPAYHGHMEIIRELRRACGPEFILSHDPVQGYTRQEALVVGRLLDELEYVFFEDPIRTTDKEGLIWLADKIDTPLHVGEFIYSVADFAEYIRDGALHGLRFIADNVGGISGSMRLGLLADAHGIECVPHNWGNGFDVALHFHIELALPNVYWFEMPWPHELVDRPYFGHKFRCDADGYVPAPTAPGLGYPLDMDALDKMTTRIDR
jgi:L-alanine-DL-glutamate epimerase-like enolase superfamily enzyme